MVELSKYVVDEYGIITRYCNTCEDYCIMVKGVEQIDGELYLYEL